VSKLVNVWPITARCTVPTTTTIRRTTASTTGIVTTTPLEKEEKDSARAGVRGAHLARIARRRSHRRGQLTPCGTTCARRSTAANCIDSSAELTDATGTRRKMKTTADTGQSAIPSLSIRADSRAPTAGLSILAALCKQKFAALITTNHNQ